jgi:pimeloyl-ACP methyl ester carboxylesterase
MSLPRVASRQQLAVAAAVTALITFVVAASPADAAQRRRRATRTTTTVPARVTVVPAPSTTTTAPPGTTAPSAFTPTVTWTPCGSNECGTMTAPLDYANPAGPTATLTVTRRRATDQANRIGVLIVNPGGPGGSAVALAKSARFISSLPPDVPARFDIVGIDPRGVAGSIEVTCSISAPSRSTPRDVAQREFAQACGVTSGSLLAHVGTDASANDIESMRIALGEQQVSFLGFSYGTYLGALYAQRYPDRVRVAILDAAVDSSIFGVTFMQDQMRAYERTLNEFLGWCQNNTRCPLSQGVPDVRARYDEMQFIAAKSGIGREKLDKEDLEFLVSRLLGENWSTLGRVLSDLSKGSTTTAISVFGSISGDSAARYADGSWESVACRDGIIPSARPGDPGDRLSLLTSVAPHFTDLAAYWATEQICSTWPVPARERTTPAPTAVGKILVVGNTLDVRTPLEWSQRLAQQLGAPLLTFESYRHTATGAGDACVSAAVAATLLAVQLPANGTFCANATR